MLRAAMRFGCTRRSARLLLWATLVFAGCTQGEGDACQLSSDCDDGLICAAVSTETGRGTCEREGSDVDGNTDELPDEVVLEGGTPDAGGSDDVEQLI